MALDIEGVMGTSFYARNKQVISYGGGVIHNHTNQQIIVDSPMRLIKKASPEEIRSVIKFTPMVYLSACKKLGIEENTNYLVIHANLTRKFNTCFKDTNKKSVGNESSWAEAIYNYFASDIHLPVIIIGSDSKFFRKFSLKNIFNASRIGLNMSEQMSLISKSKGFVGMSSGPSVLALLDSIPFYIFKDANHHGAQMQIELGEKNQYAFSVIDQFYVRKYPNSQTLYESLVTLTHRRKNWDM